MGRWKGRIWTINNATMALYFAVTGKKDNTERIIQGIESRIGRDGELYKTGVGEAGLWTYSNTAMALYFAVWEKIMQKGLFRELNQE